MFIVWQLIAQAVLLPPPFPSFFHCFYSVTGACSSCCMGAHGWVTRICQPWEQSSSRSWLPIVEAPGCFRHPTSILTMQLLIFIFLFYHCILKIMEIPWFNIFQIFYSQSSNNVVLILDSMLLKLKEQTKKNDCED